MARQTGAMTGRSAAGRAPLGAAGGNHLPALGTARLLLASLRPLGSRRFACGQNRRERLRTGAPRTRLGFWGGRNSEGRPAHGKRIRRGPCEAQRRLGAAGPPSRREHAAPRCYSGAAHKRDARRSRAGARANHWLDTQQRAQRRHPGRFPPCGPEPLACGAQQVFAPDMLAEFLNRMRCWSHLVLSAPVQKSP